MLINVMTFNLSRRVSNEGQLVQVNDKQVRAACWHCSKETKAPKQPQWQLFPKQIHFDPPARSLYNNLFCSFELIMSCSVQKPANSLENEGLQVVIMHFRYFRLNYTNFLIQLENISNVSWVPLQRCEMSDCGARPMSFIELPSDKTLNKHDGGKSW